MPRGTYEYVPSTFKLKPFCGWLNQESYYRGPGFQRESSCEEIQNVALQEGFQVRAVPSRFQGNACAMPALCQRVAKATPRGTNEYFFTLQS
eukprot:8095573-Pyramimonas_sp.AAC.1